jgi:glutaredoxin
MTITLYVRDGCSHCATLEKNVAANPSLQITIKDASEAPMQVKAVPLIVLSNGRQLIGGDAFNYVHQITSNEEQTGVVLVAFVLMIGIWYFNRK